MKKGWGQATGWGQCFYALNCWLDDRRASSLHRTCATYPQKFSSETSEEETKGNQLNQVHPENDRENNGSGGKIEVNVKKVTN